ncbi:MAG: hypothetical protein O2816_16545 [Planctomycetota bacterium]|nr:hypothetical protein [Planctomycetota bacterium]
MTAAITLALLALPGAQDHLGQPVRLEADGAPIDITDDTAYAGPWVTDHDGDGRADLIVTSISGHLRWYRNVAESGEPRYEHQGHVKVKGEAVKFWNW